MRTEITVGPESSLQDILDMLPPGATVKLQPGVYRQKLQIRTPGLTLIGAGAEKTKLVYDDYAKKLRSRRRASSFKTAPLPGKKRLKTAASSWPAPGGTAAWLSLKTAATKRISARRALTPGWTAAGTRPPASSRSRSGPEGSAGQRLRGNRKDSGCTFWNSPRFRCWCSPG